MIREVCGTSKSFGICTPNNMRENVPTSQSPFLDHVRAFVRMFQEKRTVSLQQSVQPPQKLRSVLPGPVRIVKTDY